MRSWSHSLEQLHQLYFYVPIHIFIMQSVEKGTQFDQTFLSRSLSSEKQMILLNNNRVTDAEHLVKKIVKIDKLEIFTISLSLSLVVFLDSLIEHIEQSFYIPHRFNSFLQ